MDEPPLYTDAPLALLHTLQHDTGKTDPFTVEASHMALSHNAFIRGFNSIYQQAPRVPASDKADFVGYCIAWHDCVDTHHHYEEKEFFPNVNKAAGRDDLMQSAVHDHGANFSGAELVAIMDSFKDALYSHLQSEPQQIVDLSKYSAPEKPIDILAIADVAGKKQMMSLHFVFNVLPVFFLNMDTVDFEDGMWHEVFPPLKGAVKWTMMQGVPMWQSRRWRFASCSPEGRVKQLAV